MRRCWERQFKLLRIFDSKDTPMPGALSIAATWTTGVMRHRVAGRSRGARPSRGAGSGRAVFSRRIALALAAALPDSSCLSLKAAPPWGSRSEGASDASNCRGQAACSIAWGHGAGVARRGDGGRDRVPAPWDGRRATPSSASPPCSGARSARDECSSAAPSSSIGFRLVQSLVEREEFPEGHTERPPADRLRQIWDVASG